jgi:hypothetical protein
MVAARGVGLVWFLEKRRKEHSDFQQGAEGTKPRGGVLPLTADVRQKTMKPKVTKWSGAPQMDTGAPMPHVELRDGQELLCAYMVSKRTLPVSDLEEYAVIAFHGVSQFMFGYPNDEALRGHPLYSLGLSCYAFNRIENSPYLVELGRRNALSFPGTEGRWTSKQHHIVTFHDETLEVVCRDVEYRRSVEASSAREAILRINAEPPPRPYGSPEAGSPSGQA